MLEGMSALERFAGWLSCPDCERDLDPITPDTLACSSGHRVEVNRRGYLGLIASGWRIPTTRGGTPGADRPVGSTLAAMLPRRGRVVVACPASAAVVTDIGAPPGLVVATLSPSPRVLETVVARTGAAAILADPARRWPVRDGAAVALVAVDAPSAPLEFHRTLAPGGALLLAPTESDAPAVVDDLFPWFEHDQTRPVPDSPRVGLRLRRRRRMLTW